MALTSPLPHRNKGKIIKKYAVRMGYLTGQTHTGKLLYSNIVAMALNTGLSKANLMLIQNLGLGNILYRKLSVKHNITAVDFKVLLVIQGFGIPILPNTLIATKVRTARSVYFSIIALEAAGLIERKKRIKTEATKIHITEAGVKVVRSYLVALARLRRQHYNI
jgi:DNA-binding MarR family transcriptional regulator